ncbi:MAG: hypothetical protein HY280_05150 [Nitrospinae bacterium]|nr:hypothetical protein [Nitrospinota bacterium]
MKNIIVSGFKSSWVFRSLLLGLLFVAVSPLVSHAVLSGTPNDKTQKIHEGDKAFLDAPGIKKAHEDGKAIVLMFGNIDHCIWCEKTWTNVKDAVTPYRSKVMAALRNYRASKFIPPDPDAEALAKHYGIIGEPWIFMIDKDGTVKKIFKGLTYRQDLVEAVRELVGDPTGAAPDPKPAEKN